MRQLLLTLRILEDRNLTASGLPETTMSNRLLLCGRRYIADRPKKPAVIVPVPPCENGELDGIKRFQRSAVMYDSSFIDSVDNVCQGIVVTITDTPNRQLDPGYGQALGIFYRDIFAATVAVMNKTSAALWSALMQSLLKRIEYEVCMGCAADATAYNAAGEDINLEGHINKP